MENMNTSANRVVDVQEGASLSSRVARSLVIQQLRQLREGTLTVRQKGLDDLVFGDGDSKHQPAELVVHDQSTWRDLLTGGSVGAAEAYVAGDWTSPDLTALLRFFTRNIDRMNDFEDRFSWVTKPALKGLHWLNRNTKDGSRKNISNGMDSSSPNRHLRAKMVSEQSTIEKIRRSPHEYYPRRC